MYFTFSNICHRIKIYFNKLYCSSKVHNDTFSFQNDTNKQPEKNEQTTTRCPRSYNYESMNDKCLFYENIFGDLEYFKDGDRLNIYDNNVKISTPSLYQGVERWYYTQSRHETLNALSEILKSYFYYCSEIFVCCRDCCFYDNSCIKYPTDQMHNFDIPIRIQKINMNLKHTVKKLWSLYKDDEDIVKGYVMLLNKIIRIELRLKSYINDDITNYT